MIRSLLIKQFIAVYILILFAQNISASHLLGGYIRYEYLGSNKYGVYLNVYRDCNGIAMPTTDALSIKFLDKSGGSLGSDTILILKNRIGITDVTYHCTWSKKNCSPSNTVGKGPGTERHTYYAVIDMYSTRFKSLFTNSNLCQIVFSWQQCCRNSSITTGLAGQNFYIESSLNLCTSSGTQLNIVNNSPISFFENRTEVCCNNKSNLFLGSFDTSEYDSVSYSLVPAKEGPTTNCTYGSPFTYQYPLTPYCTSSTIKCTPTSTSSPPRGFYFDSTTGFSIFTPTKCDEVFVIAVKTKEYRKINSKWELVGTTLTDRQFNVNSSCGYNNRPVLSLPVIDSLVINKSYSLRFQSKDDSNTVSKIKDTSYITIYNPPVGSKYTRDSPFRSNDSGYFTFKPGYVWSERNYKMLVGVSDNHCDIPALELKMMNIRFSKVKTNYIVSTYIDKNHNCKRDLGEKAAKGVWFYLAGIKPGLNDYFQTNDSGKAMVATAFGPRDLVLVPGLDFYSSCSFQQVKYINKKDTTINLDIPVNPRSYIAGQFYQDNDSNCIWNKSNEFSIRNKLICAEKASKYTNTDSSGRFKLYLDSGIYSLALPTYYSNSACNVSSKLKSVKLLLDSFVDLGVLGVYDNRLDLSVLLGAGRAVRGKDFTASIIVGNRGSNSLGKATGGSYPKLKLKYDKRLIVNNCHGCGSDTSLGILDWKLSEILGGDSIQFSVDFNVDKNKLFNGDNFKLLTWVDTSFHDLSLENNASFLKLKVLSPYDPNAKMILIGDSIVSSEKVIYHIDFQNLGTDTAFDVLVVDTLSKFLNPRSIDLGLCSFPCYMSQDSNVIKFGFHRINLTDTLKNKEKSKGFIEFSVSPKFPIDTSVYIQNAASIYFDYEVPVKTNITKSLVLPFTEIKKVDKSKYCGETDIIVTYRNYSNSILTKLKLELSDTLGGFVKPVELLSWTEIPDGKVKIITAMLPVDLPSSKKYKLRIIPVSPFQSYYVLGSVSFEIESVSGVLTTDKSTYCDGDTIKFVIAGSPKFDVYYNGSLKFSKITPGSYSLYKVPSTGSMIEYIAFANSGCFKSRKLIQKVNQLPVIQASIDNDTICAGEKTKLNLSGTDKFKVWYKTNLLFDTVKSGSYNVISYLKRDVYQVTGISNAGCKTTVFAKTPVTETHKFQYALLDSVLCRGQNTLVMLNGMKSYDVYLNNSNLFKNVPSGNYNLVPPLQQGLIKVWATTAHNCLDSGLLKSPFVDNGVRFTSLIDKDTVCRLDSASLQLNGAKKFTVERQKNVILNSVTSGFYKLVGGIQKDTLVVFSEYAHGCLDTTFLMAPIMSNYHPLLAYTLEDTICMKDSTLLYLNNRDTYKVQIGNALYSRANFSSSIKIPGYDYKNAAWVYGYTRFGCVDSIKVNLPLHNLSRPNILISTLSKPVCGPIDFTIGIAGAKEMSISRNSVPFAWLGKDSVKKISNLGIGKWMFTGIGVDRHGCSVESDTQVVVVNSIPLKPILTISGARIISNYSSGNKWFFGNKTPTGPNDTLQNYYPLKSGYYYSRYTDSIGCESVSDSVLFTISGVLGFGTNGVQVFPNPFDGYISIISNQGLSDCSIISVDGKVCIHFVIEENTNSIRVLTNSLPVGLYYVRILDKEGHVGVVKVVKTD